jgi:hypothetical protein
MADLQRIIDEAKPMLEEFLSDIALHRVGSPLDFPRLLKPLSRWVDAQEITEDDRFYLASRIGAFICEYLIAVRAGRRVIEGGRILMRVPLRDGLMREFDPYAVAVGMIANRSSLQVFLDTLGS